MPVVEITSTGSAPRLLEVPDARMVVPAWLVRKTSTSAVAPAPPAEAPGLAHWTTRTSPPWMVTGR